MEIKRVVRILEYVGPSDWVTRTLERSLCGHFVLPNGASITELDQHEVLPVKSWTGQQIDKFSEIDNLKEN